MEGPQKRRSSKWASLASTIRASISSFENKSQTSEERKEALDTQQTASSNVVGEVDAFDERFAPSADHVHYKTLTWWQAGVLMIAECISLGILALPQAMAELGILTGFILIIGLGVIAGYTGYVIGQFKLRHPSVTSMADAGMILGGPVLREILGLGQLLVLMFIMAAHITSFAVLMNVLTKHGACTIVFMVVGTVISILCTMPRTLKNISYLSITSCLSIFAAIFIVMVAVGVVKPNPGHVQLLSQPGLTLVKGMNVALNIVLAYAGHITYFSFASELKNPRDFKKSLIMLMSVAIPIYAICAFVIYYYVGPDVPAPALSAASPKIRIVAYAVAAPTIIIAGVVNGSVGAKQMYLKYWQWKGDAKVIQEKSFRAYASWIIIVVVFWFISWIVAESIPKFEYVLALVAALLSGWFSYGITSFFWYSMNKGQIKQSKRKMALAALNLFILILGLIISILGLYTCAKGMSEGHSGKPFSCESNDPMWYLDDHSEAFYKFVQDAVEEVERNKTAAYPPSAWNMTMVPAF